MPKKAKQATTIPGRYSGSQVTGSVAGRHTGDKEQGGAENRGKRGCVTEFKYKKKDVRG